jgi:hypothetical protein
MEIRIDRCVLGWGWRKESGCDNNLRYYINNKNDKLFAVCDNHFDKIKLSATFITSEEAMCLCVAEE